MATYDVHNPEFGHSIGYFDATGPAEAITSAVAASGYVDLNAVKDIEGTLEAVEVPHMMDGNDPDPDWHGFAVGYIAIYRTYFAVGTAQEIELAEQALTSHNLPSAPVHHGEGPDAVTTCRMIFGK